MRQGCDSICDTLCDSCLILFTIDKYEYKLIIGSKNKPKMPFVAFTSNTLTFGLIKINSYTTVPNSRDKWYYCIYFFFFFFFFIYIRRISCKKLVSHFLSATPSQPRRKIFFCRTFLRHQKLFLRNH